MSGSDPRLSDPVFLRLAGLRLQRRTTPHHVDAPPIPPQAWWDEFWTLVQTERHGQDVREVLGMPEADVEALQDASERG